MACAIGVAALASGCGSSRHANEQRPQVSTRVSVTIGPRGVIVQPTRIAFGPEKHQQIPQNQNHPQPRIRSRAPLDVTFVAANQTATDTRLRISGAADLSSEPIFSHSPGTYQVDLPSGRYTISAAGMPGSASLAVGPYRASSQNDVLLP